MDYNMNHDIIDLDKCSTCPAAAFGSPRSGSGITAALPRLCHPDSALAETLDPRPLSLGDRHNTGEAVEVIPLV